MDVKLSYLESKNISMSRDFRNHLQNGDNIYIPHRIVVQMRCSNECEALSHSLIYTAVIH